ncbi:MAG: hypothetical protein ACRD3W_16865, partial [Terriglobales bacterium]
MKTIFAFAALTVSMIAFSSGCTSSTESTPPGSIEVHTQKAPASTLGDTNISTYPGAEGTSSVGDKFCAWVTN